MNYKTYCITLWIACIISPFAVIPFTQSVSLFIGNPPMELTPWVFIGFLIEGIIAYGLLIFYGMRFAEKLGAQFLLLDGNADLKNDLFKPGFLAGVFCATIMLITDRLLPASSWSLYDLARNIPPLHGLLGAFFGVINQEVFLCLLCISGIALLLRKLFKHTATFLIMGASIKLAALIFGIAHLPIFIDAINSYTMALITRILILNAISGITFGLLFLRKGFETAIFAHIVVDLILYVLIPSIRVF